VVDEMPAHLMVRAIQQRDLGGAYFPDIEVSQIEEVMKEKMEDSVDNGDSSSQNAGCPIAIPDHQRNAYSHRRRKAVCRDILGNM